MKVLHNLLLACILIGTSGSVTAQTGREAARKPGETSDDQTYRTILLNFDYTNNSDIIGKLSESIHQPSYTASVSFLGKTGFDATVMTSFVSNSNDSMDAVTSEIDLLLGYQFKPIPSITIYPGYGRFFYSKESNALQKIFTDELHVDVDFNHRFFNLGLTPGFYFGKKSTFYFTVRNYYTFNFNHVVFRNSALSVQPGFDLNFGDFEYLNRFYVDELKENDYFYQYLLLSKEIRHYVYEEKTRNPELTVVEILDIYIEEQINDPFKLTSASFYLPVSYFLGNLGLNAGMYIFLPVHQPDYLYNDVQLFFNVGISYNFDL